METFKRSFDIIIRKFHHLYGFNFQDMNIEEKEIVDLVNQIEELEQKLFSHPVHKVCLLETLCCPLILNICALDLSPSSLLINHALQSQDVHQVKCFQRKAEVNHEIQQLKSKMRESQVRQFDFAKAAN